MLTVIFFLILVGVVIGFSFFWYWAMKKHKASLRLLAVIFGLVNLGLWGFFWYAIRDDTYIILAIGSVISQSVFILTLPKIALGIYKKMGIKW